jgi:hypothetical protein
MVAEVDRGHRGPERGLVDSLEDCKHELLIDFILRADPYLIPALQRAASAGDI